MVIVGGYHVVLHNSQSALVRCSRIVTIRSSRRLVSTSTLEFGIYSRRAFEQQFQKQNLKLPHEVVLQQKSKNVLPRTEKPWPKSVQIVGYTALILGVPYTIGTLLSEIPLLQQGIQEFELGRQLMDQCIRPYWGHTDPHPYIDDDDHHKNIKSLEIEPTANIRKEQENIQNSCSEKISYSVQIVASETNTEEVVDLPGSTKVTSKDIAGVLHRKDSTNIIGLDFLDQSDDMEQSLDEDISHDNFENSSINRGEQYIRHLTTVWSAWNYFNNDPNTNNNTEAAAATAKSTSLDEADNMERMELEYQMQLLETEYSDPNSIRDRDTIMDELQSCRTKYRQLQRRLRWTKVKSWFSA